MSIVVRKSGFLSRKLHAPRPTSASVRMVYIVHFFIIFILSSCSKGSKLPSHVPFKESSSDNWGMITFDGKVLFMGGLDLCFGRYEYKGYPLYEPIEGK